MEHRRELFWNQQNILYETYYTVSYNMFDHTYYEKILFWRHNKYIYQAIR